ncbi:MAG: mitochondrial fission ELM1 family protein [Campylobacter sp.]|nr:mitochondrial fission ELM1 family protein [Campylobacter sp.]
MENVKALIISDSRPGHQSQSEAFCKLKGWNYDIVKVSYKNIFAKLLTYALDYFQISSRVFKLDGGFACLKDKGYSVIVSAGSGAYYPCKYIAKKLKSKSVAMMYPKGFRKNFDIIIATAHDNPKNLPNLFTLPVNVNFPNDESFYTPNTKAVAFIIGGDNSNYKLTYNLVGEIASIKERLSDYEQLITTSPRTPKWFENELDSMDFDFRVVYSQNPINPISDFLNRCEYVFITVDSVSMISEAVCNGSAGVVLLPLIKKGKKKKFERFVSHLANGGYLQIYDPNLPLHKTKKFDLKSEIDKIKI